MSESTPSYDKEFALFIHGMHASVISELKDRQWQIFRWTIVWYASVALIALEKPTILAGYEGYIQISLVIAFVAFALVLFHTQCGLKKRRDELRHLRSMLGDKYNSLRLSIDPSMTNVARDWQVWGAMIALNFMGLLLATLIVKGVPT